MPVHASNGGSTGGVTGPGSPYRLEKGRFVPSSQEGMGGRLGLQCRHRRAPQAHAVGPHRPFHRTQPGGGDSVGDNPKPYITKGVESDRGQARVRGTRQLGHSPQATVRLGKRRGFSHRRRRLRQRLHGRGIRHREWAHQQRARELRTHERAVPPGTRGAGLPRRLRGWQRVRPLGLPEVYPRRFNFPEPPTHDMPTERMLQEGQVGPCPPVLPQLRMYTRGG